MLLIGTQTGVILIKVVPSFFIVLFMTLYLGDGTYKLFNRARKEFAVETKYFQDERDTKQLRNGRLDRKSTNTRRTKLEGLEKETHVASSLYVLLLHR